MASKRGKARLSAALISLVVVLALSQSMAFGDVREGTFTQTFSTQAEFQDALIAAGLDITSVSGDR